MRRQLSRTGLLALVACLMILQGCLYGNLRDASDDTPLENATILANAQCDGDGCADATSGGWIMARSGADGFYYYNPYHSQNPVGLSPLSGEEAVLLLFQMDGYQPRYVWHYPSYGSYTYAGNTFEFTVAPTVYLCREDAVDTDGDSICDEAEARYGTDPNNADTDGDSLSDRMELFGLNGLDLRHYGADPLRKDIFLEIDYYPGLQPDPAAVQMVINAFADAPVSNPDGSTGIDLHVIVDDEISAADVDDDLNPAWSDFDLIKDNYFESRRRNVFHYTLFANQHNGGRASGYSRGIPAQDVMVTMGNWSTPGGTIQQQAGTLMHELGHNLGLRHGGDENANYKPNYLSIMSYNYQLIGMRVDGEDGVLDFSRLQVASIDEGAVSESAALDPLTGSPTTEAELSRYGVRVRTCSHGRVWLQGNAGTNLDFSRDGSIDAVNELSEDLNGDCDAHDTHIHSINDWEHLVFDGGGTIGGITNPTGLRLNYMFQMLHRRVVAPEEMEPCATEDDM